MTECRLHLPEALARRVIAAAERVYPHEACGLIEGLRSGAQWEAAAIHETANLADDPRRAFLIDPSSHFALLRALRHSGREVIGCFHSHPDGAPAPSERDRAEAAEHDFLWLIAGGSPDAGFALAAFRFDAERQGFVPVPLAQRPGASP